MTEFTYKDLIVIYEDNHIIVVVKPQGIPSQADKTNDIDMLSVVKDYIKVKANKPGNVYVGLVHRLDRPTGGVMVFAKTSKAAARLSEQFKNKDSGECEKEYFCITCGVPKEKTKRLVHYLKKNPKTNVAEIATLTTTGAQEAVLEYEVKQVVGDYALLRVKIETGRHHQIRAQLAAIGCPIAGDSKYGASRESLQKPLALWAVKLTITHPTEKDRRTFIMYPPTESAPWKAFEVSRFLSISAIEHSYAMVKEELKDLKLED